MSLPVIPKKNFEVKSKFLPGGKLTLQPFTVGLENLLLQVKDTEDEQEKLSAIKQVVQACIQTPDVAAGQLPLFVLEELFIRLRQNSIGEIIDQQYQCSNEFLDTSEKPYVERVCNTIIPIQIDIRDFKIVEPEGHQNVIKITDDIGVKFRYPSLDLFEDASADTSDEFETIITCIESIFDSQNVYPAADHSREELSAFWSQLTLLQKKDVYDKFFNTMPHLNYKKAFPCKGCGHIHTLEFNNVQDVFQ